MKKKAELGIHLIKANHGITEGREPMAMLPQIFLVCLAEAFIQPSNRKTKVKGKMSATVHDIRKPTFRIGTQVNIKKFLFGTNAPCICHRPSLGIDSSLSMLTTRLLFHCEPSLAGCFPLSTSEAGSEGSIEVTGSSLAPWPWLRVGISLPTTLSRGFTIATGVGTTAGEKEEIGGCPPDATPRPQGTLDLGGRGRLLEK